MLLHERKRRRRRRRRSKRGVIEWWPGKPAGRIKSLRISGSQDNPASDKRDSSKLRFSEPFFSRKPCSCTASSNVYLLAVPFPYLSNKITSLSGFSWRLGCCKEEQQRVWKWCAFFLVRVFEDSKASPGNESCKGYDISASKLLEFERIFLARNFQRRRYISLFGASFYLDGPCITRHVIWSNTAF